MLNQLGYECDQPLTSLTNRSTDGRPIGHYYIIAHLNLFFVLQDAESPKMIQDSALWGYCDSTVLFERFKDHIRFKLDWSNKYLLQHWIHIGRSGCSKKINLSDQTKLVFCQWYTCKLFLMLRLLFESDLGFIYMNSYCIMCKIFNGRIRNKIEAVLFSTWYLVSCPSLLFSFQRWNRRIVCNIESFMRHLAEQRKNDVRLQVRFVLNWTVESAYLAGIRIGFSTSYSHGSYSNDLFHTHEHLLPSRNDQDKLFVYSHWYIYFIYYFILSLEFFFFSSQIWT